MPEDESILTINGGSSSIKFSLYKIAVPLKQILVGQIENIGTKKAKLSFKNFVTKQKDAKNIEAKDHNGAAIHLIDWLENQEGFNSIKAIGHRIVHGMQHTTPEIISAELLKELKKISAYDPDHLPEEIRLIESFGKRYPLLKQVACFDTSFHTSMPKVAKLLSIPHRYFEKGIQRYGFHGLSYSFLMEELNRLAGSEVANGKVILSHLGSGASLAAVKEGRSVDTSMGFTPASGLPMSTRTGDLDPGVAWYLMQFEKLNPEEFSHLINHESGLLGVSETSADMRELMEVEDINANAKEAIELFCYQTKKWIGSFTAVLGGLDTLVFSGGIGEHSPEVRSKICDGLGFLGIELDEIKNMNNEAIISIEESNVTVRVITTNEEIMIAKLVNDILNEAVKNDQKKIKS
ncbi:MAG: acetate/propionate family kinase [Bacteroidota bacterium]|nr:acetate/propionate family kinase [Bacteroidota bacterium]